MLLIVGLTLRLSVQAQDSKLSLAFSGESRVVAKPRSDDGPKDRNYWQDRRNVKKFKKSVKKKDCDCPSQMTEKQRRKYRFPH